MIAQKTRYALRSLLFLAQEQGGAPVQLSRIAETQRVPPKYLELIMLDLKKAGLVKSSRGPKGGYQLARGPAQISVADVIQAIDGPVAVTACSTDEGQQCEQFSKCNVRDPLYRVRERILAALGECTIAELAGELTAPAPARPAVLHTHV